MIAEITLGGIAGTVFGLCSFVAIMACAAYTFIIRDDREP